MEQSHEDPFVEKLHDQDDIEHMPRWKHIIYRLHPLSSIISLAAYWTYLVLRIKFTLHAQYMAHEIFYMAWLFLAVEMGVACRPSRYPPLPSPAFKDHLNDMGSHSFHRPSSDLGRFDARRPDDARRPETA